MKHDIVTIKSSNSDKVADAVKLQETVTEVIDEDEDDDEKVLAALAKQEEEEEGDSLAFNLDCLDKKRSGKRYWTTDEVSERLNVAMISAQR